MEYLVTVKFYQNPKWSQEYSYLYHEPLAPRDVVLVPHGIFFNVAAVKRCEPYKGDAKIALKRICSKTQEVLK